MEIERERLKRRVDAHTRAIALYAPAGYGKSVLARQLLVREKEPAICDLAGVQHLQDLWWRILGAAGFAESEATAEALTHARALWETPAAPVFWLFENAEHLTLIDAGPAALDDLLACTPPGRRICICSRTPLRLHFSRFARPHEIVVIETADLAFTPEEIALLIPAAEADVKRLFDITRGWPICLRLLENIVRTASVGAAFEHAERIDFESLYDYLVDQVVMQLQDDERAFLLAIAALPEPSRPDLMRLFGPLTTRLEAGSATGALASIRNGRYEMHAMLREALLQRFRREAHALLQQAASKAADEDPLKAAAYFLELGDPDAAARSAEKYLSLPLPDPAWADVDAVARNIPRRMLLEHPRLWLAAAQRGPIGKSTTQWLDESISFWTHLPREVPVGIRRGALSNVISALLQAGRHDDARAYLAQDDSPTFQSVWRPIIDACGGDYRAADAVPRLCERLRGVAPGVCALLEVAVRVRAFRAKGSVREESRALDSALQYAQAAGNRSTLLRVVAEALFSAWYAGEPRRFASAAEHLRDLHLRGVAGTSFLRACIAGDAPTNDGGGEPEQVRVYGLLILLERAGFVQRPAIAEAAVRAAQALADPLLLTIAHIAAAFVDAERFAVHRARACVSARRVGEPSFGNAVEALVRGAAAPRFAAMQERLVHSNGAIGARLSILRRTLHLGGEAIPLTPRECELLCYLGFRGIAAMRNELAEAIVPANDSRSADVMLRVLVTRVRKKCGQQLLISQDDGYRLSPAVEVDYQRIVSQAAFEQTHLPLSRADRDALERSRDELERFFERRSPAWEWGEELERGAQALHERICRILQIEENERATT